MQRSIIPSALIAAALLLSASLSLAAETKPGTAAETKAISGAKTTQKDTKAAATLKLVDINSASKAELKKLPGIGDAEADKIIAGRPYLSKANLVSHKIIPEGVYVGLKDRVIAKQRKVEVKKK